MKESVMAHEDRWGGPLSRDYVIEERLCSADGPEWAEIGRDDTFASACAGLERILEQRRVRVVEARYEQDDWLVSTASVNFAVRRAPEEEWRASAERIVNLTPHEVKVLGPGGETLTSYPSVGEARAEAKRVEVDRLVIGPHEVPVCEIRFGQVQGVPERQSGTFCIVSRITAEAARAQGRTTEDLLIPDDLVRDPDGQPLGCRGFARLA
jgi:hypothetical protein